MESERRNDDITRRLFDVVTEQNREALTTLAEHTVQLRTIESAVDELRESTETVKKSVDEIRLQRAVEKGMMKGWLAASAALGALFTWFLDHLDIKGFFK
jgi:methylaspartate ammonia-lyase